MEQWISSLLVVLVVLVFVLGVLAVPFYFWRQRRQEQAADDEEHDPSIIDMNVQTSNGTIVASSQQRRQHGGSRWAFLRNWRPALMGAGLMILLALGVVWLYTVIQSRVKVDQFVVVVAPFRDAGSGQSVASIREELIDVLETETEAAMQVQLYDSIPASAQEARQIAAEQSADLLIWGDVQPGGFLDDVSLQPRLTYAPTGVYAPNAWVGYRGRFHLAETYEVARASRSINGQAVLPTLVDALANYSKGSPDQAYLQLGVLLADYPEAINPTLPRMLRGNVLWARGDYDAAIAEYRAPGASGAGSPLMTVNLSSILLDRGMQETDALPEALAALNAALPGLEGAAQGTVHYNLGLRALFADDLPEAIAQLTAARPLLPENTELLLALHEAYRENGQLAEAATTLEAAKNQIAGQLDQVPQALREPASRYLDSRYREQESLLQLSQLVGARGRLAWELYVAPPQPAEQIEEIAETLRNATDLSHESIVGWQRQATTNAVARNVLASQLEGALPAETELGLVELGQLQQVEEARADQYYYLAQTLIEEGRTVQREERDTVTQVWGWITRNETPLVAARDILQTQSGAAPRSLRALLAEARAFYAHSQTPEGEAEMLDQADALYEQAIQQAEWRPEGFYGRGLVALQRNERDAAARLMQQALERNTTFFPARISLVQIAREDGDWDSVLVHLRIIQQQYDTFEARLNLAQALRDAAAAGAGDVQELRSEAERRFMAMAQPAAGSNAQRARAFVELGRLYIDQGQEDRAEEAFRQALEIDGNAAEASYALGELLTRQGDYEGARRQFLQAADTGQGDIWLQSHLALAQLYEQQLQQPVAASEHYAQLLRDDVLDANSLTMAGDGLLRHGETEMAVEAFRRASQLQAGTDPALEHRLAEAYLELDDLQAAYTHAQRVLEVTDDAALRAAAYVVQGDAVRQMKRPGVFEEARAAYRSALELQVAPIEVDAEIGLGQIAIGQNDWQQALTHFERALNLALSYDAATRDDDLMARTYFWTAEALQRQIGPLRDIPRAIRYYSQTLELRPAFAEALLGQAHAYNARDEYQQAYNHIEQALALRPDYAEALLFKARLLQSQGLLQDALSALNAAIEANDELAPLFYHRGTLLIQQGEFDAALDDLERAVELEPGNSDAYYWLGRVHLSLDHARDALRALQRSIELDGSLIDARFYQGLAEESLDLIDEARASFETVIQQASDNELVQQAQEELERIRQER
jgi:tetratricopeptide (TPR) repeat protein